MSFVEPAFLLLFVPLVLIGFNVLVSTVHGRNQSGLLFLCAASVLFYSLWGIRFLPILLLSLTINFFGARLIQNANLPNNRNILLGLALTANVMLLTLFKSQWLTNKIMMLFGATQIDGHFFPLGISFYTFTQIAYLVDVARGATAERNPFKYVLFVTWFPHLIAGPIIHHREMMPQFESELSKSLTHERLAVGLTWIAIGLAKKLILADSLAPGVNAAFTTPSEQLALLPAWTGALAFTLQLYFDFSGYSDMAIGLSFLFGVRMPLNFNSPYQATSIIDFWHRWHMTLSRFLRDYLYIPLGGNRRGERWKWVNIGMVMLLGGLWHGLGWTFMAWGALHGLLLILNHAWRVRFVHTSNDTFEPLGRIATFLCVVIGWVIFNAKDLGSAGHILSAMTGIHGFSTTGLNDPQLGLVLLLLIVVWWFPNSQQILAKSQAFLTHPSLPLTTGQLWWQWRPTPAIATLIGFTLTIGVMKMIMIPGSPFLYLQF
ncbi:MAG: MBOAT family protein [Magnetococcales bacterium]|nr:MBOAT family protein [Magnetococcales bacterium]